MLRRSFLRNPTFPGQNFNKLLGYAGIGLPTLLRNPVAR
jgi:hypothetical protein